MKSTSIEFQIYYHLLPNGRARLKMKELFLDQSGVWYTLDFVLRGLSPPLKPQVMTSILHVNRTTTEGVYAKSVYAKSVYANSRFLKGVKGLFGNATG